MPPSTETFVMYPFEAISVLRSLLPVDAAFKSTLPNSANGKASEEANIYSAELSAVATV